MRVLVAGGDGYCGWPAALRLAARGHEVRILDDLSRRAIDAELGTHSLLPIATPEDRAAASGIAVQRLDLARDFDALCAELRRFAPDAIVHLAEQRSAPYSMLSPAHRRRTLERNLAATHNLLAAQVATGMRAHLVHLGSMGVYGYAGTHGAVPEGYLTVSHADGAGGTITREVLYPPDPGSIYHLSKAQDQLLFAFYAGNDGLAVTDLHQGIVWGGATAETAADPRLATRLDCDGEYGTVVNRFLVQAALGLPLSVYGSGGQTRAFIHLADCAACIAAAVEAPPPAGRVRIINQFAETLRVRDIAAMVAGRAGAAIAHVENPRAEAGENAFPARNATLRDAGLAQTRMTPDRLAEELALVHRHATRADPARLATRARWR